jgi:glucan phosphoethanolaminetransferase (alkaline phosphatase superfamily)
MGAGEGKQTVGMPAAFHNLGLFAMYVIDPGPAWAHADVSIPRTAEPSARHIVLLVDESVSGDFIDLNVPRGATPFLASGPAGVANFGLATAASNCSNASNAVLRMGISPQQLGGGTKSFVANPTIWKYAREAGFETTYIQAKDYAGTLQNFMYAEEIALIDHVLTVPEGTPPAARDSGVLELLLDTLQRSGRQFVYVNKQGAHFPYQRYAPQSGQRFQPTLGPLERIGDRQRLVNTYLNAIHHAVDTFFERFLGQADLSGTAIIYTSDHGQNLLDDGKPVTHCRRYGHNFYEVVVPLLAWAGDEPLRLRLQRAARRNTGAASHFEIFPTLLILFGYDPVGVRERYHQSLFEPIEVPMGYVSGPISGRFGRTPTWNDRKGWDTLAR